MTYRESGTSRGWIGRFGSGGRQSRRRGGRLGSDGRRSGWHKLAELIFTAPAAACPSGAAVGVLLALPGSA